jgi:hypothetical protein
MLAGREASGRVTEDDLERHAERRGAEGGTRTPTVLRPPAPQAETRNGRSKPTL